MLTVLNKLSRERGIDVIIEGEAKGADLMAREIAEEFDIAVEPYPAQWEIYGKAAGPYRNTTMLVKGKPDLVLAFHNWISQSRGTKNMVEQAKKKGVEVRLFTSGDIKGERQC